MRCDSGFYIILLVVFQIPHYRMHSSLTNLEKRLSMKASQRDAKHKISFVLVVFFPLLGGARVLARDEYNFGSLSRRRGRDK
jgi:hypothetical protein